ncbi:ATP-binding protein [Pseudomonadota bacterium]
MKIKTRVFIVMAIPIMLGAAVLLSQYWINTQLKLVLAVGKVTDSINHDVSTLTYLMGEFALRSDSARVQRQLSNKLLTLESNLAAFSTLKRRDAETLQRLQKAFDNVKKDYQNVLTIKGRGEGVYHELVTERRQHFVENILLQTQIMMTESLRLDKNALSLLISAQQRSAQVMYLVVLVSGVILALLAFAMGRRITVPLARVKQSANIVGEGNLNHRIGHLGDDEFGEVGYAFDAMVERLKRTLASRDELDREISVRKEVEETLRRKEHGLAEAQRIAQLGSWEWDIPNNKLDWSDEVYRIFGLKSGTFANTYDAFLAAIHDDDRNAVIRAVNEALADPDEKYRIEHRVCHPDGRVCEVLEQGEVTFDAQGKATYMIGTVLDVTERKQDERDRVEMARRRSAQQQAFIEVAKKSLSLGGNLEQRLAFITELSATTLKAERVSIWFFDDQHRVITCVDLNEPSPSKHGVASDMPIADYPAYFDAIESSLLIDASDAANDPRTCEFRDDYLVPNGIVSMLDVPIRAGGVVRGILCCEYVGTSTEWHADEKAFASAMAEQVAQAVIDHERRLAQQALDKTREYLNNIVDSMPSLLIGLDGQGRVTHWNREASHITALDPSVAIGKHIGDVLKAIAPSVDKILTAIKGGEPARLSRLPVDQAGETHYWDVIVYPLSGEGGVVRIDDVTDLARMEGMMIQTEKMLSLGGLAAGMAHELNNPLGSILQSIQNIQRRLSPEMAANLRVAQSLELDLHNVHRYFERRQLDIFLSGMVEAAERAAAIVANMLSFANKGEGQFEFEDLSQLVDRVIELAAVDYDLKKKYDFRSIEIVRDYAASLPLVPCIGTEIQQVVLNLLRNAAQSYHDHKRDMSARITIRIAQSGDEVRLEVEDNGPGMDAKTRQRVFEPFFTTRPTGQGTGLGLSVSYFIIVDEHGGKLDIESSPGNGTKFIISLPMEQERAAANIP